MFVKQAFEGEYPKLLRLYNDLWRRLQQFSISMTNMNSVDTMVLAEGDNLDINMDLYSDSPPNDSDFE